MSLDTKRCQLYELDDGKKASSQEETQHSANVPQQVSGGVCYDLVESSVTVYQVVFKIERNFQRSPRERMLLERIGVIEFCLS